MTRENKKQILEQVLAYLEQAKIKLDEIPNNYYWEIGDQITEVQEHIEFDLGELEENNE